VRFFHAHFLVELCPAQVGSSIELVDSKPCSTFSIDDHRKQEGSPMKRVLMFGLLGLMSVARAEYSVGAVPPDFTCTDWNGNTWNLAENQGKVVLLNFGATWCGPQRRDARTAG
jgi:thiol-disulfide isomerase/thioredoxin